MDFSLVKMGSYLLVPLLVLRLQLESIKSHWACSYPLEFVGNNFIKKKKIGQRKHIMRESWTWGWLGWFSLFPTKLGVTLILRKVVCLFLFALGPP